MVGEKMHEETLLHRDTFVQIKKVFLSFFLLSLLPHTLGW